MKQRAYYTLGRYSARVSISFFRLSARESSGANDVYHGEYNIILATSAPRRR